MGWPPVELWTAFLIASAATGALAYLHCFAKNRRDSDLILQQYDEMLSAARAAKEAAELAEEERAQEADGPAAARDATAMAAAVADMAAEPARAAA